MRIATLDFETFWSTEHTLKRMPPTEYVMHQDTEIISVSAQLDDDPIDTVFGEDDVKYLLRQYDWSKTAALGHNMSGFDSMLLQWRLGIKPRLWMCTAAMARPHYSKTEVTLPNGKRMSGVSLKKLAYELGVGFKDDTALVNTKGKHLADFTADEIEAMRVYNKDDVVLCRGVFKHLRGMTTPKEFLLIHMTTGMLVSPQFKLDRAMVETTLEEVKAAKENVLVDAARMLGYEYSETARAELASAPKFAKVLTAYGVEVPMKPSKTAVDELGEPKMIPALAKTDEAMLALLDHPDLEVAALAAARLDVKSTILETRLQAFLRAGAACGGYLPVPLRYAGADTTLRWSGEQYNMQNLPRIPRDKEGKIMHKSSNALRLSLLAPKGKKVIVADLSGIELRVNHFLWQVPYSTRLWKRDPTADPYRAAGAIAYSCTPEQITKDQRQLEKVKALGLGFGAGAATFQTVAKLMGGVVLDEIQSQNAVDIWRGQHTEIVGGWKTCHKALDWISRGIKRDIDEAGLTRTSAAGIHLPSDRRLISYPNLHVETGEKGRDEWWYGSGRHRARIYAGKVTENIVQALARDVIADNAVDFFNVTGLSPALMVHDELVYVVDEDRAEELLTLLQEIMRTPPKWWPSLVTWSEGDIADSYGEAK